MISKNTIKLIKSLALKKYRTKENSFLVEGDKNIVEVLNSDYNIEQLFATESFLADNKNSIKKATSVFEANRNNINKASLLQHPQNCLAICTLPLQPVFPKKLNENLSIYLDDVQDPGNLGTIIRICDWFNIEYLFCSPNTADIFNPKVIQASMGSFCRVKIIKTTFEPVIELAQLTSTQIYGAFLDGQNIYTEKLPERAILIMGNEGNGIQKELGDSVHKKIKIPGFSNNSRGAESLNVSVATAVLCSEFKRRMY